MHPMTDELNNRVVTAIAANSNRFREHYFSTINPDELAGDWSRALDFFLGHACYQGRRDAISDEVYKRSEEILRSLFSGEERDMNYESGKRQNWAELRNRLSARIGKGQIGKARDVEMIISVLDFIGRLPGKNLLSYSISRIRSHQTRNHYRELQRAESKSGIVQVGPKIAAMYLRDVASLFGLEDYVGNESAFCLQPIDTWVRQIVIKLGLADEKADDPSIQQKMVQVCASLGISPLRLSQGMWYTGYNALDLLLDAYRERGVASEASII